MQKNMIPLEEHIRLWQTLANPSATAEEKEQAQDQLWDARLERKERELSKAFYHQEEEQVFPVVFPEMSQIPLRLWEEQPTETLRKLIDQLTVYLTFWGDLDANDPWEARDRLMQESNLYPWGGLDEILRKKNERIACDMWGNPYPEEDEDDEDAEEPEDEVPFVPGEWARLRRRFLQRQRPKEWQRMLEEQEASTYLAQIERNYQEEYLRICEKEEEHIPQEELTFLELVQRRNAIGQTVKEFLMEELQH